MQNSEDKLEIGRVVTSLSGRDKGRSFIITALDPEGFIYIVDGSLRKIANPKKKKLKHVRVENMRLTQIADKIKEGKPVFDGEVRGALMDLGLNIKKQGRGPHAN